MAAIRSQSVPKEMWAAARAAYARFVEPHLTAANDGKFVALDFESGDWEIGEDDLATIHRLADRSPDPSKRWLFRVGKPYVDRMGATGPR